MAERRDWQTGEPQLGDLRRLGIRRAQCLQQEGHINPQHVGKWQEHGDRNCLLVGKPLAHRGLRHPETLRDICLPQFPIPKALTEVDHGR